MRSRFSPSENRWGKHEIKEEQTKEKQPPEAIFFFILDSCFSPFCLRTHQHTHTHNQFDSVYDFFQSTHQVDSSNSRKTRKITYYSAYDISVPLLYIVPLKYTCEIWHIYYIWNDEMRDHTVNVQHNRFIKCSYMIMYHNSCRKTLAARGKNDDGSNNQI